MNPKPLWPLALLALLYWEAPKVVPNTVKLARVGILGTAALMIPGLVYASLYGLSSWSPEVSTHVLVLGGLEYAGMFLGFALAAVCCFLDAKRGPSK
jgi:hypothetical protein